MAFEIKDDCDLVRQQSICDCAPKIDKLIRDVDKMSAEIENLIVAVHSLKKHNEDIMTGVSKMSSHIDMVDGVYKQVKHPFHTIMDYASIVLSNKTPSITADDNHSENN